MAYWPAVRRCILCYAVILTVMSALCVCTGCGGAGGGTGGGSTPPPPLGSPVFASTPPSSANEGDLWSYAVSVTDPAGKSVALKLTTAPVGAALANGSITWTPSATQARNSQSFTLTATTDDNRSGTQSWTVTPTGTIRGTWISTFETETGDVIQPEDLSQHIIKAIVPKSQGSPTILTGTGSADGTFSIAKVPAGSFWLQYDTSSFLWTDAGQIDLGSDSVGRPDVGALNISYLSLNLNGLVPLSDSRDYFEWFVPNTATNSELRLSRFQFGAVTVQDEIAALGYAADAAKGDRSYVTQLSVKQGSVGSVNVLSSILGPLSVVQKTGSEETTEISGTMTYVPLDKTTRFSFKGSILAPMFPKMAPSWDTASTYLLLEAYPFGRNHVDTVLGASLVAQGFSGVLGGDFDAGDVAYGNPFPAEWPEVYFHAIHLYKNVKLPGTISRTSMTSSIYGETKTKPTASAPLQPIIGPVESPTVNGKSLTTDEAGIGTTPTLAWHPPLVGTATGYSIRIVEVYALNGETHSKRAGYLCTASTSVQLPPGVLQVGSTYIITIRAIEDAGSDYRSAPFRSNFPRGAAESMSGMIAP